MKKIMYTLLLIVVLSLVFVSGCQKNDKQVEITTALLREPTILNGATTDLIVDAKNEGTEAMTFKVVVNPELEDKVTITYPSNLEFTLQPSETIGNKIIVVSGTTDATSTSYLITVELVDNSGIQLDKKDLILTVQKE